MTERTYEASEPTLIRIHLDRSDSGLLFATSPDLQGLLVAERTAESLVREIPIAITNMYAAIGEEVSILKVESSDGRAAVNLWVKVPTKDSSREFLYA